MTQPPFMQYRYLGLPPDKDNPETLALRYVMGELDGWTKATWGSSGNVLLEQISDEVLFEWLAERLAPNSKRAVVTSGYPSKGRVSRRNGQIVVAYSKDDLP